MTNINDLHKIVPFFSGGSNVDIEDANGRNCVHLAAYHGDDNLEATIERCRNIDTQVNIGDNGL